MAKYIFALMICALGINPGTVRAKPPSFSDKVAEAKDSIIASADEAFVALWREKGSNAPPGITAGHMRSLSRWVFVGYSFGLCEALLTPTDKADWITRLDVFGASMDSGSGDMLLYFRGLGEKFIADGRRDDQANPMPEARKASWCRVELAAAREVLRDL